MRIGVLGAGMIGGTVGRLWHAAGHEVRFGTRRPDEVSSLVRELGARASAGTPEEAIDFGDAILLAVPLKAVPDLGRSFAAKLAGKVVLDATNPYPGRDGALADAAVAHARGASGWVSEQVPGARVVKAFNTVYFKTLAETAHEADARGDRVGIPLAADDEPALRAAALLVRDAGFEPIAVGPLARGRELEPGTKVYNTGMRASELRSALHLG